jgi:hypothetical protein
VTLQPHIKQKGFYQQRTSIKEAKKQKRKEEQSPELLVDFLSSVFTAHPRQVAFIGVHFITHQFVINKSVPSPQVTANT